MVDLDPPGEVDEQPLLPRELTLHRRHEVDRHRVVAVDPRGDPAWRVAALCDRLGEAVPPERLVGPDRGVRALPLHVSRKGALTLHLLPARAPCVLEGCYELGPRARPLGGRPASSGQAREFETGGEFPDCFVWLDDDLVAVDLRDDNAMVIDAASGQVSRDLPWSQAQSLTPWQIVVQTPEDELAWPVVLQEWDAAGELVEEVPLGFTADAGSWSVLAEDRIATVLTNC